MVITGLVGPSRSERRSRSACSVGSVAMQEHAGRRPIRLAGRACRKRVYEMEKVRSLEALQSIFRPFAQVAFAQAPIASDDHQMKAFAQPIVRGAEGECS